MVGTETKSKFKKYAIIASIVVVSILGIYMYWKYFATYSDGYRSGLLQKFSRKGVMFKTYEGELVLGSIGAGSNNVTQSEKFYFSVTDESVAKQLEQMQGSMVTIHYHQKNSTAFWRGESEYIIEEVKAK